MKGALPGPLTLLFMSISLQGTGDKSLWFGLRVKYYATPSLEEGRICTCDLKRDEVSLIYTTGVHAL